MWWDFWSSQKVPYLSLSVTRTESSGCSSWWPASRGAQAPHGGTPVSSPLRSNRWYMVRPNVPRPRRKGCRSVDRKAGESEGGVGMDQPAQGCEREESLWEPTFICLSPKIRVTLAFFTGRLVCAFPDTNWKSSIRCQLSALTGHHPLNPPLWATKE